MDGPTDLDKNLKHAQPEFEGAYGMCLEAENYLRNMLACDGTPRDKAHIQSQLNDVRILGHLLVHGPSETSKAGIVKVVLDTLTSACYVKENLNIGDTCARMLVPLGDFLNNFLIRPCKSGIVDVSLMVQSLNNWSVSRIGDETLEPGYDPSTASFEVHEGNAKDLLLQNPLNIETAKELVRTLSRDGCGFFIC